MDIGSLLGIGGAVAGGFGQSIRQKGNHGRQKELMQIQFQNQMALNQQGHELGHKMWQKTNYPAQMKMLKEAGLNPALLYGQSGAGGATTSSPSGGSASGAQASAPMDIGSIVQAGLAMAQKKLLDAQAKKTESETRQIDEVGIPKGFAEMDNIIANTKNTQANTLLTKFKSQFQELENALQERTFDTNASILDSRASQMIEEVHRARRENRINDATEDDAIKAIELSATKIQLENLNLRKDLSLKDSKMYEIQENIQNNYDKIRFLYDNMNTQSQRNWNDYQLRKKSVQIDIQRLKLQKLLGLEGLKQGEAKIYIDAIGTAFGAKPSTTSTETWTSDGQGKWSQTKKY